MGIRPNKSGDIIVNPPDTSQNRWGDWVTGLEGAGDTAGGVVSEIDSKAESANTGSGELAGDLTVLEGRVGAVETGKANSVHTHTMSQISDMPVISGSREGLAIARYDIDGRLQSNDPVYGANTTNKNYVDGLISALESRIEVLEGRLNAAGIPPLP